MSAELSKGYEPGAIEPRWAEVWIQERLFEVASPGKAPKSAQANAFVILLPPPNVTGRLHMGHMLNQTLMDILVRWRRMRGDTALWIPGTDHASIATQMMVERQLAGEGTSRKALGREKFLERAWQWKQHYGGAILGQMKRLGVSVDWSREYFTMDEHLSATVREVFVRLYEEGLIYRGNYIVNWCPSCGTAISDLEVVHKETQGKLYEIRYPAAGTKEFITVATTRPETMLGDTAVAVNPADARYRHLHGKQVLLPLMEREIPIILDEVADPEFGTGAVKITPAHDANDFKAGQRHNLPQVDVMDESGRMNRNAGKYQGLDRFKARAAVLKDLESRGLLAGVKDYIVPLGHCQRCDTVVEPRLSMQWFAAVNRTPRSGGPSLAGRATEVVRDGTIRITPENYRTIYLNWMENIYDWTISRQLWWGHRIPAWHCAKCAEITVAREAPAKCPKCGGAVEQDPDVLDTWFSSALLPFTSLGWPEKTPDLAAFYPTSLLVTSFDILFLWVARMIMMGCHFMASWKKKDDDVPFREVYIHALVRDAEGEKMSKTKGNVVDPIEITEKYGTDAVRFTLAAMASPGTDIAFNPARTEGYRAFANKIWNAARFIFLHRERAREAGAWSLDEFAKTGAQPATLEDRWILSRFHRVAASVNAALAEYRFHEAANSVYDFFWGEFCDWYIELVKPRLDFGSAAAKASSRTALFNVMAVFEGSLRLLSPIMPFLCEELWHALYEGRAPKKSIALAGFPESNQALIDDRKESDFNIIKQTVESLRWLRVQKDVPTKERVPIEIYVAPFDYEKQSKPDIHAVEQQRSERVPDLFRKNLGIIENLARGTVTMMEGPLQSTDKLRIGLQVEADLVFHKKINAAAERERLSKELKKMESELANAQRQLGNQQFLEKAPEQVVAGMRKRTGELDVLLTKTRQALAELK